MARRDGEKGSSLGALGSSRGTSEGFTSSRSFGQTIEDDRPAQSRPVIREGHGRRYGSRNRPPSDGIPAGYDRQIWLLAQYFSELAEDEEEQLDHGLPIIYQVLARRIEKEWPEPRSPRWHELALEMVTEFWDKEYHWGDRFPDEDFTGIETWNMLRERCLNRLIDRDLAADKEAAK